MTKMKKLVSLLLGVVMAMGMMVPAIASENLDNCAEISLTNQEREVIIDIPIYVTYINPTRIGNQNIQEIANQNLCKQIENSSLSNSTSNREIIISNNEYNTKMVSQKEKIEMCETPFYVNTLKNAYELTSAGVIVKSINFFVVNKDENNINRGNADPSDPNYWLNTCTKLGTRNGYQFLYTESAINVETDQVVPGNLASTMNWKDIFAKSIKIVADRLVKNKVYDSTTIVYDVLSTIIDGYTPALSVSYSTGGGYVKAKVSGTVYQRTIFLEDKLNKFSGYAYYTYGATQRLVSTIVTEVKYPIKKNASGTYEYKVLAGTSSAKTTYTPGYLGNTSLYDSILECYKKNTYVTHEESIDVKKNMTTLLS